MLLLVVHCCASIFATHNHFKKFAATQVFNEQVPRHELGEGNAGLVVIRNGTVRVHWLRGKDNHWRFACIKSAVEWAKSLSFPDTAFIVNIDDFPICKDKRCPLPVFTNYKKWRNNKNLETNEVLFPVSGCVASRVTPGPVATCMHVSLLGSSSLTHTHVLAHSPSMLLPLRNNTRTHVLTHKSAQPLTIPFIQVFNHHYEDLYMFPWHKKRGKAMMRASQQGCMPANSSR